MNRGTLWVGSACCYLLYMASIYMGKDPDTLFAASLVLLWIGLSVDPKKEG
jgi:hypothetical protein